MHIIIRLKLYMIIQFIFIISLLLDSAGLKIPVLRQIICFLYLTFVPGFFIAKVLRLDKLPLLELCLYSIGLSLTALMFIGFSLNCLFSILGWKMPISLLPVSFSIIIVVTILFLIQYHGNDTNKFGFKITSLTAIINYKVMLIYILPLLAIFGAFAVNNLNNSILLKLLILYTVFIILCLGFNKVFSEIHYPIIVFLIALALLYHNSLVSRFLWGWDIFVEYQFAKAVLLGSFWDSSVSENVNAMLSIVFLAPIYSIICDVPLDLVFKIIYPFLFSLCPLTLYLIFRKQFGKTIALFSSLFFIFQYMFFQEMISLARQEIAEFFLSLLMLSLINENLSKIEKIYLFLLLSYSLVVSHYGLTYIFIYSLIFAWISLLVLYTIKPFCRRTLPFGIHNNISHSFISTSNYIKFKNLCIFIIFGLTWYIFISNSSAFITIVNSLDHIISSIFSDFLDPASSQGLSTVINSGGSELREVAKGLYIITIIFIVIGVIVTFLWPTIFYLDREYFALCLSNLSICVAGICLPYVSGALNTSRLYQISLLFLSPFCFIGMQSIVKKVSKIDHKNTREIEIFSIILSLLFLFNSGIIYEFSNDPSSSFSLNSYEFSYFFISEADIYGAEWLLKEGETDHIYCDYFEKLLLSSYGSYVPSQVFRLYPWSTLELPCYVYIKYGDIILQKRQKIGFNYVTYSQSFIQDYHKIYDSGCQIYRNELR